MRSTDSFPTTASLLCLSQVEKELDAYEGNIWTHIISLRREDADRLGFDHVKAWQDLLSAKKNIIAINMNIAPEDFKWYAAFHNEGHHPHVHMIAYSTHPSTAFLGRKGIRNIKASLAKEIFKDDLLKVYKKQTEYRDEIKAESKEIAEKMIQSLRNSSVKNETILRLLFELRDKLKTVKGKKVYGYLKPELKVLVNRTIDELEKDKRIKALYQLWYAEKDKVVCHYTNEKLKRVPLSQNKEFSSIRNRIIKEALRLDDFVMVFDEDETDEPIILSEDEAEPEPPDSITDEYFTMNSFEKYITAKRLLDKNSEDYDPETGLALLKEAAEKRNEYAQYRFGKILIQGELCEQDIRSGIYWLEKSVAQDNEWAEYYLGKQYLGSGDVERNFKRAIHLLRSASKQGNRYAQYTLACQYLFSGEYAGKESAAVRLLEHSAGQHFAPQKKCSPSF